MGEPLRHYDDEEKQLKDQGQVDLSVGMSNNSNAESGNDKANSSRGMTPDEINSKEASPEVLNNSASDETRALDQVGKGFNEDAGSPGIKGKIGGFMNSKRRRLFAGIAALVSTISIIVTVITSPGLIINNMRDLILNHPLQEFHARRYRRNFINKTADFFSKDGRLGGKIISEMEGRGYQFKFGDSSNPNKATGLITPRGEHLVLDGIGEEVDDFINKNHNFRSAKWKTKRATALYNRYGITRKSIVAPPSGDEVDDPPDKVANQRVAKGTIDDEAKVGVDTGKAGDNETSDETARREGVDEVAKDIGDDGGDLNQQLRKAVLEDGEKIDVAARRIYGSAAEEALESGAGKALISEIATGAGAQASAIAQKFTKASIGTKVFGAFRSIFNPTEVLDKVCTLKNRLRLTVAIGRTQKAITLMRYSALFIGVGDAIRTGEADSEMVNEVMKRIVVADTFGNYFGSSSGFSKASTGMFSKSKNDINKPAYGVDGQITGVFGAVQSATDNVPGTSMNQCSVIQNPVAQITSGAVTTFGKGVVCVFTAGVGCAGAAAGETALRTGITQSIKTSMQNAVRSIFTKQVAKQLAFAALVELSFEGIMILTQMHIEQQLALPVTGQETGGELSSILLAGGGTANKQRSLDAGMVPVTTQQFASMEADYLAWQKEERAKDSLFERYLDTNNTESLAFKFATTLPIGLENLASSAPNLFAGGITGFLGGGFAGTILSPTVYADDQVEYGSYTIDGGYMDGKEIVTDFAGNPEVMMRPDIEVYALDPNNVDYLITYGHIDAENLQPKSEEFKDHYINCVQNTDIISPIEFNDESEVKNDCLANLDLTRRFKGHLAYLDLIDGLEAEFFPEEIGESTGVSSTPGTPTTVGESALIVGNTSDTPCPVNTTDLGPTTGYKSGNAYQIRLCGIPEIPSASADDNGMARVNSTIAAQWSELAKKAQMEGINLRTSSSFRSQEKQEYLYNCYVSKACNGGREAAKPGMSNHQFGAAIDIDIVAGATDPSLTTCKASPSTYPVYAWLATNAPRYGINAAVASECWHWSSSGGS